MTGRAQEILHSIVRSYIQSGEPVGSRTLSKLRYEALSPASIRNVMADLSDEGYLSQPHTSAGRVPTAKAFQHFVSTLSAGRMPTADAERVRNELRDARTVEHRLEKSSHILTELSRNIGIAAAIPVADQELDQIELLRVSDLRVLMIVVTRDHNVRNRVVDLNEPITPAELVSLRNYVNQNFAGWKLGEARRELLRRVAEERAAYDEVLRKLSVFACSGLLDNELAPDVHMEGASNLVGLDLHLTREKLRELFRALEEKRRLIEILERFLEQSSGELAVQIGLEEAHPTMRELALIGIRVLMPNGMTAQVAVLGPMRMQYERVMSAVLHIGRTFEQLHEI